MEKKIDNILLFTRRDGSQLTFRVLFTYHSDNFNKDYAVFYNEADENHLIVYSYDVDLTLHEINSSEEYAELETVLHKYDEEMTAKDNK